MKRILVILPNLDLGGMEIVVINFFRNFKKVVFDFVVHGEKGYFEDEARALGSRIFRIKTRKQGFFKNIFVMREIYKKNNYDFVIVCTEHSFAFIELFVAWASNVRMRAVWSMFSDYQGHSSLKRQANFFARPLLRLFTNLYLACTRDAGLWLFGNVFDKNLRKKTFHIINNAIDLDEFSFSPQVREKIRKMHGLTSKFIIGLAGRLSAVKNHSFALDVFKEICSTKAGENTILLIVGEGELRADIEAKARRLEISERVVLTGRVESIAEYYQAMDILLIPSFHEGLPLVAIEAQAARLNVLMSDTIACEVKISELAHFESLEAGAAAWAKTILRLRRSERKAVDLSDSGYHITREAEKLQNILLERTSP